MTPVEIIALIVIITAAIKMIVLIVNPKSWINFTKKSYSKPGIIKIISLVLAVIVLYCLLSAGITIVDILAVTAFVALLIVVGLADEIGSIMKKYEALLKKRTLWKEYWLYALLWIILLILGLIEILA